VKLKEEKVTLYKKECSRKADEKTEMQSKLNKQIEKLQMQTDEARAEKDMLERKLLDEKDGRSGEIAAMTKQLREMADKYEADIKSKEDKIQLMESALQSTEAR